MDKTVKITKKEYYELRIAKEKLNMLENYGVDNWASYGEALYPDDDIDYTEICDDLKKEIFGE